MAAQLSSECAFTACARASTERHALTESEGGREGWGEGLSGAGLHQTPFKFYSILLVGT